MGSFLIGYMEVRYSLVYYVLLSTVIASKIQSIPPKLSKKFNGQEITKNLKPTIKSNKVYGFILDYIPYFTNNISPHAVHALIVA